MVIELVYDLFMASDGFLWSFRRFLLIIDCCQSFIEILFSFSVAYEEVATRGRGQLKKNAFFRALPELPNPPPHYGLGGQIIKNAKGHKKLRQHAKNSGKTQDKL